MYDLLVIGAGPAGMALAAALSKTGLRVAGLTPGDPAAPWLNTYGIWADELDSLDLPDVLSPHWTDCSAYMHGPEIRLDRVYALFDNQKLQSHLLGECERGGMDWQQGIAAGIDHSADHSTLLTGDGKTISARLVVDASGHFPALVARPAKPNVAYQAAYGVKGRFSAPPVRAGQLVLMDYRADHLTAEERRTQPPTFLYAMDLGDALYFVEETSLAFAPAVSLDLLKERLERRLAHYGVFLVEAQHVERCLFPMNLPLPDLTQPILGYGGAASMVHPASGYQVGMALKRAATVAAAISATLAGPSSPVEAAQAGWNALWPSPFIRNRNLYLLGLESLMSFNEAELHDFFTTFFNLPHPQWTGYLSNTLSTPELARTMFDLFTRAPGRVRRSLIRTAGDKPTLLWQALTAAP
ncbi:MAG: lycopene cyclase family protein [Caldilineaceae bacterium]|nr:lycopene cyclase family protein [Caldilineaceae bacterium]